MKILLLFILLNTIHFPNNQQNPTDYFIAMQYKGLSNCIYKIYVTDSLIMGAKVNGYIAAPPNFGIGTVIPADLRLNPESYVNRKMEAKYSALITNNQQFLAADKQNFIIRKKDVKTIFHDPTKKWGMGPYPHNGKIIIQTTQKVRGYFNDTECELILVGDQDPQIILKKLGVN